MVTVLERNCIGCKVDMDKAELKRPSNFKSHIQFKKDGELPVSDYNQQESAFSWPMHLLFNLPPRSGPSYVWKEDADSGTGF